MTAAVVRTADVILGERVVAVIRADRVEDARAIATSCLAGGLRAIEVTLTVPEATDLLAELVADGGDEVIIGAGTVLRAEQVAAAVDAGARFLVAPVTDRDVLAAGRTAGILTVPGAFTPTEVATAHDLGARLVKVFPAGSVGPSFVGALGSVLPEVRLMPTGGVGEADVERWLDAGAAAVGIASDLNRAYAAGGPAGVEALASRLARHAARPLHLAEPAPDRRAP